MFVGFVSFQEILVTEFPVTELTVSVLVEDPGGWGFDTVSRSLALCVVVSAPGRGLGKRAGIACPLSSHLSLRQVHTLVKLAA